jgi:TP901 family phage tail tape measure protein
MTDYPIKITFDDSRVKSGTARVRRNLDDIKKSALGSNNAMGILQNSLKTIGVAAIGIAAVTTALRGMYNAVSYAATTYKNFERSMSNVKSVAGATKKELEQLERAAREQARVSVFTAQEAADAQYYLASAGQNTQEIIASLNSVMTLAAATQSDLAFSSDVVSSSLSQFGLRAEDSARVSNVFAAAISGSQANLEKIAASMRQVGPIAATLGQNIEGTTAQLMALYNAGLRGEQAGTALRGIMLRLQDPTKEAQAAFDALGVSVVDMTGKTKPLNEILADLEKAGFNAGDATKLFGQEGAAAAKILAAATGKIKEYEKAITGTEAATKMANEQMDNLDGDLKQLYSAVDELAISFGKELNPGLRSAAQGATTFVNALRDSEVLNAFAKALGFVADKMGRFMENTGRAIKYIDKITTPTLSELRENMKQIWAEIEEAQAQMDKWSTSTGAGKGGVLQYEQASTRMNFLLSQLRHTGIELNKVLRKSTPSIREMHALLNGDKPVGADSSGKDSLEDQANKAAAAAEELAKSVKKAMSKWSTAYDEVHDYVYYTETSQIGKLTHVWKNHYEEKYDLARKDYDRLKGILGDTEKVQEFYERRKTEIYWETSQEWLDLIQTDAEKELRIHTQKLTQLEAWNAEYFHDSEEHHRIYTEARKKLEEEYYAATVTGAEKALYEWTKNVQKFDDVMYDAANSAIEAFDNAFSGTITAIFRGEFDDLADIWTALWQNLVNIAISALATLAGNYLKNAIGSLFDFGGTSGGGAGSSLLSGIGNTLLGRGINYITDALGLGEWFSSGPSGISSAIGSAGSAVSGLGSVIGGAGAFGPSLWGSSALTGGSWISAATPIGWAGTTATPMMSLPAWAVPGGVNVAPSALGTVGWAGGTTMGPFGGAAAGATAGVLAGGMTAALGAMGIMPAIGMLMASFMQGGLSPEEARERTERKFNIMEMVQQPDYQLPMFTESTMDAFANIIKIQSRAGYSDTELNEMALATGSRGMLALEAARAQEKLRPAQKQLGLNFLGAFSGRAGEEYTSQDMNSALESLQSGYAGLGDAANFTVQRQQELIHSTQSLIEQFQTGNLTLDESGDAWESLTNAIRDEYLGSMREALNAGEITASQMRSLQQAIDELDFSELQDFDWRAVLDLDPSTVLDPGSDSGPSIEDQIAIEEARNEVLSQMGGLITQLEGSEVAWHARLLEQIDAMDLANLSAEELADTIMNELSPAQAIQDQYNRDLADGATLLEAQTNRQTNAIHALLTTQGMSVDQTQDLYQVLLNANGTVADLTAKWDRYNEIQEQMRTATTTEELQALTEEGRNLSEELGLTEVNLGDVVGATEDLQDVMRGVAGEISNVASEIHDMVDALNAIPRSRTTHITTIHHTIHDDDAHHFGNLVGVGSAQSILSRALAKKLITRHGGGLEGDEVNRTLQIGEHITRRSSVNYDTIADLRYINIYGKSPRRLSGGSRVSVNRSQDGTSMTINNNFYGEVYGVDDLEERVKAASIEGANIALEHKERSGEETLGTRPNRMTMDY